MQAHRPYQLTEPFTTLIVRDFNLDYRRSNREVHVDAIEVAQELVANEVQKPLIYTAFDGDHFHLCSHMRYEVLKAGAIPANPESILGYKDTLMARQTKLGILLDDLAIVRGCDAVWVFTDKAPEPSSLPSIAEGVVIEILYFLRKQQIASHGLRLARHSRLEAGVYFMPVSALLESNSKAPARYNYSYEESVAALHPQQAKGITSVLGKALAGENSIPEVNYFITDPLDFKYAHWLRAERSNSQRVPLVPGLAVELADFRSLSMPQGRALAAWATLSRLCHHAVRIAPIEADRAPSLTAAVLSAIWAQSSKGSLVDLSWRDYYIPKAMRARKWALTELEGLQA